ncbi:MAG: DUF3854 domain-containing protein [Cyanobacteria bacterium P01_A01_bin.17]
MKWELWPEHIEQLAESGIDPVSACVAGIFSADAKLAQKLTGYRSAGLIFLYFNHAGDNLYKYEVEGQDGLRPFARLRPDIPSGNAKYLSPKDSGVFPYWPRTIDRPWRQLSNRKALLTEGEKKALCMTLAGWPTIGLGGVSSYTSKFESSPLTEGLWQEVDLRQVERLTIVFDSDITHKSQVRKSIVGLAKALVNAYHQRELEERGDSVRPVDTRKFANEKLRYSLLPNTSNGKCGIDDALMRFGKDAIAELLNSPLPLVHCEIKTEGGTHELKTEVLFASEPCGDSVSKKVPLHRQRHVRSLLAWLTLKNEYMNVPGVCYYRYDDKTGIWQALVDKEQWEATFEQTADLNRWQNRSGTLKSQALSMITNRLMVESGSLNKPNLLAFTNGVLDFNTGKLESARPGHLLTRQLGFDYDPNAGCMTWLRWLSWVFDNSATKIELVRALFRWSFTPKPDDKNPIEVYPILIGKPGHGKGTFLEVMTKLAGQSYGTFSYDSLMSDQGRFKMLGKLITVNTDLKGRLTDKSAAIINQICSNEPIEIKKLFKNGSDARLGTVLWAAMNRPLSSNEQEREGIDRRIVYLRFQKKPTKKDPFFNRRLESDLPGIFNWFWSMPLDEAVNAIDAYMHSSEALSDHEEFLADRNTVYEWLVEMNHETAVTLLISDLHEAYVEWAQRARYIPLGKRKFIVAICALGAQKQPRKNNGIYYTVPAFKELDIKGSLGL